MTAPDTPKREDGPPETAAALNRSQPASGPEPTPSPPKGPRLRVVLAVIAAAGALALLAGVKWSGAIKGLVAGIRVSQKGREGTNEAPPAKIQYYTCGMHPWVILPKPGVCPICGMKLVPLDISKFTGEVAINPVIAQDIGVRIAPVVAGKATLAIRTVGAVDYDETLVRDVNLKISGWVEKLCVDYVGAPVRKGDPLMTIYSPDLLEAQRNYLAARAALASPGTDASADSRSLAEETLQSARERLRLWDFTDAQFKAIEATGRPEQNVTVFSKVDGVVTEKTAYEGMKVESETRLYRIADLSKIWVMATLYEYQLPYVRLGQEAVMSLPYLAGRTFEGKVAYIYPYLNPKLRQINARLEFDNPNLALKPGMFADIVLRNTLPGDRILVPREAVIDTGERQVAFVSLGQGRFEPRNVKLGVEAENDQVEVLDGLKAGEMVVTSGEFLLDSEARLQEALAKMIKGNLAGEQETPAESGTLAPMSMPMPPMKPAAATTPAPAEAVQREEDRLVSAYLQIQKLLAADTTDGVEKQLSIVAEAAKALASEPALKAAAGRVSAAAAKHASGIDTLRLNNKVLSDAVIALAKVAPPSVDVAPALYQIHCPMANADWLQTTGNVANPYYGKSMPTCGSVVGLIHAAPAPEK